MAIYMDHRAKTQRTDRAGDFSKLWGKYSKTRVKASQKKKTQRECKKKKMRRGRGEEQRHREVFPTFWVGDGEKIGKGSRTAGEGEGGTG